MPVYLCVRAIVVSGDDALVCRQNFGQVPLNKSKLMYSNIGHYIDFDACLVHATGIRSTSLGPTR
jgi:hypothetical protein